MDKPEIIEKLETQLAQNDTEILYLLKRRLQTSRKIGTFLRKQNLKPFYEEPEQVVKKISALSLTMELRQPFVKSLFENLVEESNSVRKKEIEKNS
ncbi:chorismate mutase [Candidatus Woesearchaeota archaeon]|nr:chorismate mutase [Nanoarchaeota archaeon]MCB9370342.1 chorismate mutase [Candidatus Woesearchaeota archaeon]USN44863.1 MAG: chorismate mutase [Candidatus Woesearchaeota archaeon]